MRRAFNPIALDRPSLAEKNRSRGLATRSPPDTADSADLATDKATACQQDPTSHAAAPHEARRDSSGRVHGALMEQSGRKRARTVANRPTGKTAQTSRKAWPTIAVRCAHNEMVRRGSTVRVRQRACKILAHGDFPFRRTCPSSHVRWVWSRLWSFRVREGATCASLPPGFRGQR